MNRLTRIRRQLKTAGKVFAASTGTGFLRDRMTFRRALPVRSIGSNARAPHVILAPPGDGNIGDQAMVEAFLENTPGPIVIVARRATDIRIPAPHLDRTRVEAIPSLIFGTGGAHRAAVEQFARVLAGAASLTVTGADSMDGAYDLQASTRRADAATLAALAGVPTQVLGFSWNASPKPGARRALARADRAGTRLLLRDPASAQRARDSGFRNVVEVADSVFAAQSSSLSARTEFLGETPGRYVVINASGLVGRSTDQVTDYSRIVRSLLDSGIRVLLIPHVLRASADDLTACRAIFDAVDDERVVLVSRQLDPAEIRGLCAGALFVLTGRMHLAIQALWSRVPAITLATQGKVEGLMQLFDTPELCVAPGPGLADRVIPLSRRLVAARDPLRSSIDEHLPAVKVLASRNFLALAPAALSTAERQEVE